MPVFADFRLMYRFELRIPAWLLLLVLAGCVHPQREPGGEYANHPSSVAADAEHCAYLVGAAMPGFLPAGIDREFSLAVWNVQKVTGSPWSTDLGWLTEDFDLVLIQEFALSSDWAEDGYLSFAPGFDASGGISGVAMLSRVPPLSRCELEAREPMLRTPKATAIARFPMVNGDSLVVVNLHAVNFSLGLVNFGDQLRDAAQAVADHQGPLVFAGDFNTWRGERLALVQAVLTQLGLQPVVFTPDERTKVFGHYLDHIYVRGLEVVEATTRSVDFSDHNPMFVRLKR